MILQTKYDRLIPILCRSTFIQLLERHYDIASGQLQLDGRPIQCYNIRHLRRTMALVGQEPVLFNLTVAENIAYGLNEGEFTREAIVEAAKAANVHDFIVSLPLVRPLLGPRPFHL